VQFELMLAVALVVLVAFLFLRSMAQRLFQRGVPLSLVGTFGVMYLLGSATTSPMALTI
jgi:multidrug efflux pump